MKLSTKLLMLVAAALLGVVLLAALSLHTLRDALIDSRRDEIVILLTKAEHLVDSYRAMQTSGTLTQEQAQLVYDLAAEHVLPLIDDIMGELHASRDAERLSKHFGSDAAWQNMARQIKTWGQANLAEDVYRTLAANYDGVLAMHQMMQAREPAVLQDADGPQREIDEPTLTRLMRDPR